MLNLILAVLVPFLVTTSEEQTVSNIEVVEIFRAETPQELEAALTDGYPMPWLEEILNDESIPEEDRYWLDCRVRAAIARDLNLFYDRDGNPIHIECDYMHPGEDYWREHFIVNPPGESFRYDEPDRPANIPYAEYEASPGYIVDLYGETVGEIAITRDRVWLSRDASVGIYRTGSHHGGGMYYDHACLLYPDGSFREQEIDGIFVQYALSQDGNVAVFYSMQQHNPDSQEHMLYAFDREGNLIFQRLMPIGPESGSATPAISPDSRYIAAPLRGGEVWLLDGENGDVLQTWGGGGQENRENFVYGQGLVFSPDSRYLCAGGCTVLDCLTGEVTLRVINDEPCIYTADGKFEKGRNTTRASNGADLISNIYWTYLSTDRDEPNIYSSWVEIMNSDGTLLFNESCDWKPYLSPNGCFLLGDSYDSRFFGGEGSSASSTPFEVILIEEVE